MTICHLLPGTSFFSFRLLRSPMAQCSLCCVGNPPLCPGAACGNRGEKLDRARPTMIENLIDSDGRAFTKLPLFSGDIQVSLVHCCDDEVNFLHAPVAQVDRAQDS